MGSWYAVKRINQTKQMNQILALNNPQGVDKP